MAPPRRRKAVGRTEERRKVTTTLRGDLWESLQIQAIKEGRDANDILETLIDGYLKKKPTAAAEKER